MYYHIYIYMYYRKTFPVREIVNKKKKKKTQPIQGRIQDFGNMCVCVGGGGGGACSGYLLCSKMRRIRAHMHFFPSF